jgi:hypothetical protein
MRTDGCLIGKVIYSLTKEFPDVMGAGTYFLSGNF